MEIKENNFTNAWLKTIREIYDNPDYIAKPRGLETKAKIAFSMTIENPRNRILYAVGRKYSLVYSLAETLWYFSKDNDLEMIKNYAPSMAKYSNNGKSLNSGYGSRIFEKINDSGITQFDYIIQKFKQDKDTRQAIIHIRSIKDSKEDIELMMNSKDIPCTLTLHFQILANQLILIVNMRSQDAMIGLVYDTFTFTMLQELLYIKLKKIYPELSLGKFIMFASNEHIYENSYEKTNNILENIDIYKVQTLEMPSMQEVDIDLILRYEQLLHRPWSSIGRPWNQNKDIPKYWRDILDILAWNKSKDHSFLKDIDISLERSIDIFKKEII